MKRNLLAGMVLGVAMAGLSAGCAHGNGSESKGVRVVKNAQDVAGCEKVTEVRLSGTWTSGAGLEELEKLAQSKGANALLLPDGGHGVPNSGLAYRCEAGAAAASH